MAYVKFVIEYYFKVMVGQRLILEIYIMNNGDKNELCLNWGKRRVVRIKSAKLTAPIFQSKICRASYYK